MTSPLPLSPRSRRAPRSDGLQNRARIQAAARELLALHGLATSVGDIADRAGVSKGTVFRHYPTKEDLIAEIVLETLDRLSSDTAALLDSTDPSSALREFMVEVLRLQARDQGFCDVVGEAAPSDARVAAAVVRIGAAVDQLTREAKAVGAIRDDITGQDIVALTNGIHHASRAMVGSEPEPWQRYLDVVLTGLRA